MPNESTGSRSPGQASQQSDTTAYDPSSVLYPPTRFTYVDPNGLPIPPPRIPPANLPATAGPEIERRVRDAAKPVMTSQHELMRIPNEPTAAEGAQIITWKQGVRFLMTIHKRVPRFEATLTTLHDSQMSILAKWSAERTELVTNLEDALKKVDEAFAKMKLDRPRSDADRAPIAAFDASVWQHQTYLDNHIAKHLAAMGVPFFGTEIFLIARDEEEAAQSNGRLISKPALLQLQRRMLQLLFELFVD